jgi:hypothetical protein
VDKALDLAHGCFRPESFAGLCRTLLLLPLCVYLPLLSLCPFLNLMEVTFSFAKRSLGPVLATTDGRKVVGNDRLKPPQFAIGNNDAVLSSCNRPYALPLVHQSELGLLQFPLSKIHAFAALLQF